MKKGFIQIMFANVITLAIGVLTNFLLPKYLSYESYADVKTYALYLSYAGFFSLGYNDGMYLKYGGKKINEIDNKSFGNNFLNYFILIAVMSLLILITGLSMKDQVLIAFSFGTLSYNILGYLKSFYQSTGEFRLYGQSLNIEKELIFIFNMIFIFLLKKDAPLYYIWIQVLCGIVVCSYLSIKLNKKTHFLTDVTFSVVEMKENIKSGFILMLGNFSSGVLTGIDRWFVKIFLTSIDFAKFSFAVSMENIMDVFTMPVTIAMYNYFCKRPGLSEIKLFKNASLMWGVLVMSLAYPSKFILENYLTKYQSANEIIFILFATQMFNIIVKGIYVNIYKAQKQQNKYLKQMIFMLLFATVLDLTLILLFNSMLLIAVATLITMIVWLVICEFEKENEIRFNKREYMYMLLILITYITSGYLLNSIAGFFIFILFFIILSFLLMNRTTLYLVNMIKQTLLKVLRRTSK